MGQTQLGTIAFAASEDKSSSELGGAMPQVTNVIVDATGVMRARPGLAVWPQFTQVSSSAVIGMCSFQDWLVYVTADRLIHAISSGGGTLELSDPNDSTTWLDGGGRPSFVKGHIMLVIAGGGQMQKWLGTGLSARLLNTGAPIIGGDPNPGGLPPAATHICGVAQRLIAKVANDSGQFWWSGALDLYEDWDMTSTSGGDSGFIQAAAKPDPLVAMFDSTNEIFAFGTQTLQVFDPSSTQISTDPVTGEPVIQDFMPNRTIDIGITAPDSVIPIDSTFYAIDRFRRVIVTDARSYQEVGKPISKVLRDIDVITDALGFKVRFGRFDFLVWLFPSVGYGIIMDTASGKWSEWRAWGPSGPTNVTITSVYDWAESNLAPVGLSNGQIALFDDDATTDLGNPINIKLVSGFTDHGMSTRKHCHTLLLTFRRTFTPTASSGHVRISYRDYEGAWILVRDVQLGDDPYSVITLRSLGVYRMRQWMLEYTGSDRVEFVSAQEEYEILGA
jgi:hypothetical protein